MACVTERFYVHLIPEARHIAESAAKKGMSQQAAAASLVIESILDRPEHKWATGGAEELSAKIREAMEQRYGQGDTGSGTSNE